MRSQLPWGQFPIERTRRNLPGWPVEEDHSPFATAYILHALASIPHPAVASMTARGIDYFLGDNVPGTNIPTARTAPFTFRQRAFPNGTVYEWTSAMMVSTVAFPDPSALPTPVAPIKLETVGARLVAARQFSTSSFPTEQDFVAACAGISADTLPAGFAVDEKSAWSPTYVFYNAESSTAWESECWVEVRQG